MQRSVVCLNAEFCHRENIKLPLPSQGSGVAVYFSLN
jgi:hypothetical protein